MAVQAAAGAASRSVLGLRRLGARHVDAARLFVPTAADVLTLRRVAAGWGVPSFRSYALLLRALTHPAVAHWAAARLRVPPTGLSPASLEFLGDRVVGAAVAARAPVGNLLGNKGFALAAARAGLGPLLRAPARYADAPATLSNAYEAVAAAVYVDGGLAAAAAFVDATLLPLADEVAAANADIHVLRRAAAAAAEAKYGAGATVTFDVPDAPAATANGGFRALAVLHRPAPNTAPVPLADVAAPSRLGAATAVATAAAAAIAHLPPPAAPARPLPPPRPPAAHGRRYLAQLRALAGAPLSRAAVASCLALAPGGGGGDAATLCCAVHDGLRALAAHGDADAARADLTAAAFAGHRVYWLALAGAAYRAAGEAGRPAVQAAALGAHKRRLALARAMGGGGAGGASGAAAGPLEGRASGRLAMDVAVGLVVRRQGLGDALRWVDGGRRRLAADGAA